VPNISANFQIADLITNMFQRVQCTGLPHFFTVTGTRSSEQTCMLLFVLPSMNCWLLILLYHVAFSR